VIVKSFCVQKTSIFLVFRYASLPRVDSDSMVDAYRGTSKIHTTLNGHNHTRTMFFHLDWEYPLRLDDKGAQPCRARLIVLKSSFSPLFFPNSHTEYYQWLSSLLGTTSPMPLRMNASKSLVIVAVEGAGEQEIPQGRGRRVLHRRGLAHIPQSQQLLQLVLGKTLRMIELRHKGRPF